MTLREKQSLFVQNVAKLIEWAYVNGYELTFGETYRTPEQAELNAKKGTGIANSLHGLRLAIDFNLFRNGVWLPNSEDHAPLGVIWKTLHPLNRWGGDFKTRYVEVDGRMMAVGGPDGNHYSMEHGGVR